MALTTAVILLCLILINHNFRGFAVFQNLAGDRCSRNIGIAKLGLANFATCQNAVKRNSFISGDILVLNLDNLAFCHFNLLAAGFNNCVHKITSLLL